MKILPCRSFEQPLWQTLLVTTGGLLIGASVCELATFISNLHTGYEKHPRFPRAIREHRHPIIHHDSPNYVTENDTKDLESIDTRATQTLGIYSIRISSRRSRRVCIILATYSRQRTLHMFYRSDIEHGCNLNHGFAHWQRSCFIAASVACIGGSDTHGRTCQRQRHTMVYSRRYLWVAVRYHCTRFLRRVCSCCRENRRHL